MKTLDIAAFAEITRRVIARDGFDDVLTAPRTLPLSRFPLSAFLKAPASAIAGLRY
jgi:hypothetical protein